MPDTPPPVAPRDPLPLRALRYAAGDLPPAESAAFEDQLAADPAAQDALAEAVRLSAAALGQGPPEPDSDVLRAGVRERLAPFAEWCGAWVRRRVYHGHPAAWAGLGAVSGAGLVVFGLWLGGAGPAAPTEPNRLALPTGPAAAPPRADVLAVAPPSPSPPPQAPAPADDVDPLLRAAEIWAEFSTSDRGEKAHEDELRRRQRVREMAAAAESAAPRFDGPALSAPPPAVGPPAASARESEPDAVVIPPAN